MTLNRVIAFILRYFNKFGSFGANYVKVVEDRPTMSAISEIRRVLDMQIS